MFAILAKDIIRYYLYLSTQQNVNEQLAPILFFPQYCFAIRRICQPIFLEPPKSPSVTARSRSAGEPHQRL